MYFKTLSCEIYLHLIKDAVKREAQKMLNLEQTDQEMREMLQTLCKYWYAKRDKVDYILVCTLTEFQIYDKEFI